jgi:HAD superfamily hydrolase (TIGR01450 family)
VGLLFLAGEALEQQQRQKQLKAIRHFALDLDGTLYLGGRLFEATIPFLAALRRRGVGYTFFTNNSSRSSRQYVQKLQQLGIDATADDLYSSTTLTLEYLRRERPDVRCIYLLGTPGLTEEFSENGYEILSGRTDREPDAVVVGFDTTLTYARLCEAAYWLSKGKPFVATHCDLVCPTDEPTILPDCGAICQLLWAATGRKPDAVLGKPHPEMLYGVMHRHGVSSWELAVVGDRLYTDIAMARAAGAMGILVLSGETTRQQAHDANPAPDLIVASVAELTAMLEDAPGDEVISC